MRKTGLSTFAEYLQKIIQKTLPDEFSEAFAFCFPNQKPREGRESSSSSFFSLNAPNFLTD